MKQGSYSDREIINLINKRIPKDELKGMKIYVWLAFGRVVQAELKQRPLSNKEIKDIFDGIKANPPEAPVEEKPKELTLEEKRAVAEKKRQNDNKYTSENKDGIETLYFSEAGILNMIRDDHDDFEHVGEEHISDREDDGRVYVNQEVKRLSDQKMFYFNYVSSPEPYPDYSLDNCLIAINRTQ